jgi:flagellar biosynthesis protein FlhG
MNSNALSARTIAITSGKGGVGKSCVTANLACALAGNGKRVLILDGDLGLANMDILFNLQPAGTLHDVLHGRRELRDVLLSACAGVCVLPSGSGLEEYSRLSGDARMQLPRLLAQVVHEYDYVLIDTGAGISEVVLYTASLAHDVIVVATTEPTSFTDAYATVKVMASQQQRQRFDVVINQVRKGENGAAVAEKLQHTADNFLQKQFGRRIVLEFAGEIPTDPAIVASVRARQPVILRAPQTPAAMALSDLARTLALRKPKLFGLRDSITAAAEI